MTDAIRVDRFLPHPPRLVWCALTEPEPARADWTITWTLVPEGKGTRLFLVHDGFDGDNPFQRRARSIMDGAGGRR